jgi:acyl carrier protein phosphodiesterase
MPGVIVDMFYDHFLAIEWDSFSSVTLEKFTINTYSVLLANNAILPSRSQRILDYMSKYNWLKSYASLDGMQQAFTGMAHRTTFNSKMEFAVHDLKTNYELYRKEFNIYFPQLCLFVETEYGNLLRNK